MQSNQRNSSIQVTFKKDEALIFFDFLSNYNSREDVYSTIDAADRKVRTDFEAALKKVIDETSDADYLSLVAAAKTRLLEKENAGPLSATIVRLLNKADQSRFLTLDLDSGEIHYSEDDATDIASGDLPLRGYYDNLGHHLVMIYLRNDRRLYVRVDEKELLVDDDLSVNYASMNGVGAVTLTNETNEVVIRYVIDEDTIDAPYHTETYDHLEMGLWLFNVLKSKERMDDLMQGFE